MRDRRTTAPVTGSAAQDVTERADTACCCDDPADARWGRLPGAQPPLRWWIPAVVFVAAALVLTLVIVLVVRPPGPGDNPIAGDQRDGLLIDGPKLASTVAGVDFGGRPVVVLFERTQPGGPLFEQWRSEVSDDGVDLIVVVAGTASATSLAAAVRIPTPTDGGPPVGYAVVDPARQVRYSTLDPVYVKNAFEVDVITAAVADVRP